MGATPAEQTKSLLGREKPVDVQPGSIWLWLALLVASVFRQWAYSVLASLYALSPSDYDDKTSVRGATSLSSDEYAGIVYAYTIVAVTAMGASGACTTLFGARRTAVAGLGLQVAGCVTCGLSYGVVQLAAGTLVLSGGFGVFLTPAYSLVFGIERSGTRRVLATTTVQAAGNLGAAAASLSIVLAESFVGVTPCAPWKRRRWSQSSAATVAGCRCSSCSHAKHRGRTARRGSRRCSHRWRGSG